ncbi:MAG: hypothetical protein M1828_002745 [Chrysothrix sp. TS-e1954]|nr:MAG: hypothetical protein M1828_002745 [Chrysothrix sp. TS-e1954]
MAAGGTTTGGGWAQLRQQARQLETQTETLFHTYSQFASMTNIPPQPTTDEQATLAQLQDILSKRETTLASLTRLLDSDAAPSALKSSHLSRHRDLLTQHRSDLRTLQSRLTESRQRTNLLASVRSDISAYRAGGPSHGADGGEAEYMLEERGRIESSHNLADGVLSQAYAVQEGFVGQREMLESVRRRISGAAGALPGVNELMGRIGSKRRRDGIVLGGFVAVCFLVFWFLV